MTYRKIIEKYVNQFENHEIVGSLTRRKDLEDKYDKYRTFEDEAGNVYDVNRETHTVCVSTEDGCF